MIQIIKLVELECAHCEGWSFCHFLTPFLLFPPQPLSLTNVVTPSASCAAPHHCWNMYPSPSVRPPIGRFHSSPLSIAPFASAPSSNSTTKPSSSFSDPRHFSALATAPSKLRAVSSTPPLIPARSRDHRLRSTSLSLPIIVRATSPLQLQSNVDHERDSLFDTSSNSLRSSASAMHWLMLLIFSLLLSLLFLFLLAQTSHLLDERQVFPFDPSFKSLQTTNSPSIPSSLLSPSQPDIHKARHIRTTVRLQSQIDTHAQLEDMKKVLYAEEQREALMRAEEQQQ